MTLNTLIAASIALTLSAGAVMAQTSDAAPTSQPQGAPATDVPILGVAQASPDCGNQPLSGRAFCVTAPLAAMSALADSYVAHYEGQGWLPAAGDDNRVILVKRREGGGCDGLQMVAFYDTSRPATPEAPGYLGFATIPGDVCKDAASEPAPTTGAPAQ